MSRYLKGVGALLVLAAVAVVVPVGLAAAVGWPLPHGVPDVSAVADTVTGRVPLDPDLLWNVLAVGIWVAWVQLMAALVVEVRSVVAGHVAPHVSGLGAMQRVAGGLVGAILLLWPSASPVSAGSLADAEALMSPVQAIPKVQLVESTPTDASTTVTEAAEVAVAAPETVVHTVERRDTLWSIAQRYMAPDGSNEEIAAAVGQLFEANVGRPQASGGALVEAGLLMPGWQLEIPAPPQAAASDVLVAFVEPGPRSVVVQPGDTLWDLAETHLGDGQRFVELMDLNAGQPHVGGNLSDPSVLEPGWVLHLPPTDPAPAVVDDLAPTAAPEPAPAPEPVVEQAPPTPEAVAEAPATVEADPAAGETSAAAHAVVEQAGTEDPDVAEPSSSTPVDPPATVDPESDDPAAETAESGGMLMRPVGDTGATLVAPADPASDAAVVSPFGLMGGGVATAGLLVLLGRHRRARQRQRPPGHRVVALPEPLARTEVELRAGARPDRAALVDVALRAAAAGVPSTGLDPIDVVVVDDDTVTIWFTTPPTGPAPTGFVADGQAWRTTVDAARLAALGRDASSPAPALCPLGVTDAGEEVLVDLEADSAVFIDGDTHRVRGLLRSMTVAVASAPWATQPTVVLVGLDGDLTSLPWVSTAAGVREALETVTGRVERAVTHLGSLGCRSTAQARAVGETPEEWEPTVALSATAAADLDVAGVDALVARPGHAGALVCAGPAPEGVWGARQLVVDPSGRIDVGPLRGVVARHLDADDTRVIVSLVDAVAATTTVELTEVPVELRLPAGPMVDATEVPVAVEGSMLDALLAEVDVVVRVLGDVDVVRTFDDAQVVTGKQKSTEGIVYLALREGTVSREDLQAALWPAGATSTKTFNNVVSAIRTALGDDPAGERLLPSASGGQYRLSDRVVSDYGLFWELTRFADDTDDAVAAADILCEALTLVSGEPFLGAGRGYAWVAPHAGMIVAQVVDAAEELAEVRLATDDWRGAEWAARQGLRAMPCDERMYRLLMRASYAAGNIPGVHRAFRELCEAVADPDLGCEPIDTVHPETLELLAELTGDRASA